MAIIGIAQELKNSGEVSATSEKDERKYRRSYLVKCDSVDDRELDVLNASGLPQRFFPFPSDLLALCVDRRAKRLGGFDSLYLWQIDCEWSTNYKDPSNGDDDNPLLRPVEVSWTTQNRDKIAPGEIAEAYLGGGNVAKYLKGLTASNLEQYSPPPVFDEALPVLTVVRNQLIFAPDLGLFYTNSLNTDDFFGAKAGQVRCTKIEANREQEKGFRFWRVRMEFLFKPEGHQLEILDIGTFYYDQPIVNGIAQGDGTKLTDKDADGNVKQVLLDGQGQKLGEGLPAVFNKLKVYVELPFAPLQIPYTLNA